MAAFNMIGLVSRPILIRTSKLTPILSCNRTMQNQILAKDVIESPFGACVLHNTSVAQRFFETASLWSDQVATECGITGRKYTYDQLRELSRRFGSSLARMGYGRGDVLGMILPNIPEFPITLFGASGLGMSVSLISPMFVAEEILEETVRCGTSVLIGVPSMAYKMVHVFQRNRSIRHLILIGERRDGFVSFQEMSNNSGDLFKDDFEINPVEDTFALVNSTDTRGPSKTAKLTHSNLLTNVQQILFPGTSSIRMAQGKDREFHMSVIPFSRGHGLSTLLTSLETGGKIVTLPKFDSRAFLTAIDVLKPTILHVAPPLVELLAQHSHINMESFRQLNLILTAGASLPTQTAYRCLERLKNVNFSLQESYAFSDSSLISHLSPVNNGRIGSVGVPLSRTCAKVIDVDSGEVLGPHQPGKLAVRGPQLSKGYLGGPDGTEVRLIDSSDWLHTGDVAYHDEEGRFFIVDRLEDFIKVKGQHVNPLELEDLIRQHPEVVDVAVVGVSDVDTGESPRAYVVTKSKGGSVTPDLIEFVRNRVTPNKQLRGGVRFVEYIPRSDTGKILRRALRVDS